MARAVHALARRAGIIPAAMDGAPLRVTPHSLRKTYTTMLDNALVAVPLKARDYVTGHASEGLTLGTYTEVTDPGLLAVRAAVQAAYDAATAESAAPGERAAN